MTANKEQRKEERSQVSAREGVVRYVWSSTARTSEHYRNGQENSSQNPPLYVIHCVYFWILLSIWFLVYTSYFTNENYTLHAVFLKCFIENISSISFSTFTFKDFIK